jgi:polyhydroxyalkanoate synthesis regulator phasin
MTSKKPLAADLLELGVKLALDAAEKVMSDPRGQGALSLASELAQKAVRKLEEVQSTVSRAAGAPSRGELRELEERVAQLQRRAVGLGQRLESMAREDRASGAAKASSVKRPWRDPEDMEPR